MIKVTSLIAALALAAGATSAFAQSPAGSPADPTTNENQQMAPGNVNPADPAAGSNPSARVPTSPPGTGSSTSGLSSDGLSSGESGAEAPAGLPGDPNTNENQQMAPSNINPSDPAAGGDPDARVPTEKSAP
jgi:hypothetical protein